MRVICDTSKLKSIDAPLGDSGEFDDLGGQRRQDQADHQRSERTTTILIGGAGAQKLDGGEGNDELKGGPGRDILIGGPGIDLCDGGPGNDTIKDCEPTPMR